MALVRTCLVAAEVGAADDENMVVDSPTEVEGSEMTDQSVEVGMAEGRVLVNEELEGVVVDLSAETGVAAGRIISVGR